MSLDSKVYFKARLAKLGIADLAAKFEANGWLTLGDFAVSANYAPGATDDSSFIKDVLVQNSGMKFAPERKIWIWKRKVK